MKTKEKKKQPTGNRGLALPPQTTRRLYCKTRKLYAGDVARMATSLPNAVHQLLRLIITNQANRPALTISSQGHQPGMTFPTPGMMMSSTICSSTRKLLHRRDKGTTTHQCRSCRPHKKDSQNHGFYSTINQHVTYLQTKHYSPTFETRMDTWNWQHKLEAPPLTWWEICPDTEPFGSIQTE